MSTTLEALTGTNGHVPATAEVLFPLDSFKAAARHLRRPFTAEAVKWKVQAVWPKDNPASGLVVGYIDARLAVERLNLLVPHLWFDEYETAGKQLLCRLTVDGITRQDVGDGQGKGLYSDALKRAAVKFGVGVSLYAIPKMILQVSDGMVKVRQTAKGKTLEITPKGDARLRTMYADWLTQHGEGAFGEALNHGDVEGSVGDPDASLPDDPAADESAKPEPQVTVKVAGELAKGAYRVGVGDKLQLAATHVHGGDVGDCSTEAKAKQALRVLTVSEGEKLQAWLDKKADA